MSAADEFRQEGRIEGRIEGLFEGLQVGGKLALRAWCGSEVQAWLEEFAPDGDEWELMITLLKDEDIEFAEITQQLQARRASG